jgi:hypothetical protein
MLNKSLVFFLLVVNWVVAQNPWQQDKGEWLFSPYVSHYKATEMRDNNGVKTNFGNNGVFTNYNPRLYFSTALNGYKLNLFGTVPYFFNRYADNNAQFTNVDFGDIELGLRQHISKWGENHYLMGSIMLSFPAYNNNVIPYVGFNRTGAEARFYLTGASSWLNLNKNFHKVELAVRYFLPDAPLQYRLYAAQAYRITSSFLIMAELDGMLSYSNQSVSFQNNPQLVTDFKMLKTALNLGYEFSKSTSVYAGLFQDVYNRNIAIGSGYQFFVVYKI